MDSGVTNPLSTLSLWKVCSSRVKMVPTSCAGTLQLCVSFRDTEESIFGLVGKENMLSNQIIGSSIYSTLPTKGTNSQLSAVAAASVFLSLVKQITYSETATLNKVFPFGM